MRRGEGKEDEEKERNADAPKVGGTRIYTLRPGRRGESVVGRIAVLLGMRVSTILWYCLAGEFLSRKGGREGVNVY